MKKTPKYAQIEAELIAQIESGQLAPGAELPSESDLIECYGVSRVTVRRAIDELYHQGYVEKMQGKRACVKEKVKLQELTSISSYTEEIIRQGMTPSRKLLSFGLRVCTKEEAEQLGLKKADPVFFMERIYFADGSPLCLTSTVLPYQLFDVYVPALRSVIAKVSSCRCKRSAPNYRLLVAALLQSERQWRSPNASPG